VLGPSPHEHPLLQCCAPLGSLQHRRLHVRESSSFPHAKEGPVYRHVQQFALNCWHKIVLLSLTTRKAPVQSQGHLFFLFLALCFPSLPLRLGILGFFFLFSNVFKIFFI
jgi:hypothetical protein